MAPLRNLLKGMGFSKEKVVSSWRPEWETDYLYARATGWEDPTGEEWVKVSSGELGGLYGMKIFSEGL